MPRRSRREERGSSGGLELKYLTCAESTESMSSRSRGSWNRVPSFLRSSCIPSAPPDHPSCNSDARLDSCSSVCSPLFPASLPPSSPAAGSASSSSSDSRCRHSRVAERNHWFGRRGIQRKTSRGEMNRRKERDRGRKRGEALEKEWRRDWKFELWNQSMTNLSLSHPLSPSPLHLSSSVFVLLSSAPASSLPSNSVLIFSLLFSASLHTLG